MPRAVARPRATSEFALLSLTFVLYSLTLFLFFVDGRPEFDINTLLQHLKVSKAAEDDDDNDDMKICLPHHLYSWHEAVTEEEEANGAKIRMKRLTLDVLLPGPTDEEQVECLIVDDGSKVRVKIKMPNTYLSAKRTAVVAASNLGVGNANVTPQIIGTMSALARVQGHREALQMARVDQEFILFDVKTLFKVDNYFCKRNDWGVDGDGHAICICTYQHDNVNYRAANQFVCILHVEMTSVERPSATPSKPSGAGFGLFGGLA